MSIPYLAQREDQQQLEWIGGSVFSVLLDAEATGGQLTVGRFDVSKGEAPPFHVHNNEDEVFLLLAGSALVWAGDEELELREGGIVFLPRRIPHGDRITSEKAGLLLISTPGGLERAGEDVPPRGPWLS
ncbi:cupin domain-containing protein [Streptomyces sp. NPDC050988]|uniref:cupin domain-containing protein n=1 Tax=Streptomyces sp. NPDC050988 TaxID=3365637 RepID=UPI0037A10D04